MHPQVLYNMLFRVAWGSLRDLCAEAKHVGGLPGMTAVLHTWGADLKHHVHLHCLVTYGGLDEEHGQWYWPKMKNKLLRHRPLRNTFRKYFLAALKSWMKDEAHEEPVYHQSYEVLTANFTKKAWAVNQQRPTADPEVITAYLSRYICRIGISDKRLQYDASTGLVTLEYKDYRQQKRGQPAPLAYRELPPLVAMSKILQHVLPAKFHRSRSYGLHAPSTRKRLKGPLERWVQSHPDTVRLIIRLLKQLLGLSLPACEQCGLVAAPEEELVLPDRHFLRTFLPDAGRSPPAEEQLSQAVKKVA